MIICYNLIYCLCFLYSFLVHHQVLPGEAFDPIPHQLLRKYVGYARHYVHPTLSVEAAQVLQDFYLELRKQNQSADSTPITTRQLESLIRLTEVTNWHTQAMCSSLITWLCFWAYLGNLSYKSLIHCKRLNCFASGFKARARLELREKATQSDAADVVEIMKHR